MALIAELAHSQAFVNARTIQVDHNVGVEFVYIRVIVGGLSRQDLIESMEPLASNPKNSCVVTLTSSQSGIVQVFTKDVISANTANATNAGSIMWQTLNVSEEKETLTTSTKWVTKLEAEWKAPKDSSYLVQWYYERWIKSTSQSFMARVMLDGEQIAEESVEPKDQSNYVGVSGFKTITSQKGSFSVSLQYRSEYGAQVGIRRARIVIFKI